MERHSSTSDETSQQQKTEWNFAVEIETAEKPESITVEPENLSKEWDTVETPEECSKHETTARNSKCQVM
jgi:hypothetical protein